MLKKYEDILLNDEIYGDHNTVQIIENVFVSKYLDEKKDWEQIRECAKAGEDRTTVEQADEVLAACKRNLDYYESHKHLLAGLLK